MGRGDILDVRVCAGVDLGSGSGLLVETGLSGIEARTHGSQHLKVSQKDFLHI
jgi:hypothetical protein